MRYDLMSVVNKSSKVWILLDSDEDATSNKILRRLQR